MRPEPVTIETRKDIEFAVHDGEPLAGNLYLPRLPGKHPTLIAVHGGGWRLANRNNYQHLGAWLAAHGYVVFAVTHRLSKPDRKGFPEAVRDVRAAVQFVKAQAEALHADPERLALMGDSSGGHLAALVALAGDQALFRDGHAADPRGRISTAVKVCIPIYAVLDLARQWRHDQLTRCDDHVVQQFVGVSLTEDRRRFFDASPLSYVSNRNNATAFLVAWGTADDIVDHREQSEPFVEALKQARYFVRTVVVPDAPHFWISDPLDEPGSYPGFLAPRLLRFLQHRL